MGKKFVRVVSRAEAHSRVSPNSPKVQLARAINKAMREQGLAQAQSANLLNLAQPKFSALANYHLDGFSIQRLIRV